MPLPSLGDTVRYTALGTGGRYEAKVRAMHLDACDKNVVSFDIEIGAELAGVTSVSLSRIPWDEGTPRQRGTAGPLS